MGITLGTNIASLRAQRQLIQTGDTLGTVFERLSSGQRINRASDDAAGLAIASSLNADTRVFTQAVRNANDGLSMLSIGDGALLELTNITIRLSELAEQSANGTFSSVQRESLHEEGVALVDEYNRIVESTRFGKKDLFRVEDLNTRLQLGYGLDGSLEVSLGQDLARVAGDGTFQDRFTVEGHDGAASYQFEAADFNNDGNLDLINTGFSFERAYVQLGNGDGTFGSVRTYDNFGGGVEVADINGDGNLDAIGRDTNTVQVMFGNGDGSFQAINQVTFGGASLFNMRMGDVNGDGVEDVVALGGVAASRGVYVAYGNSDGSFQTGQEVISLDAGETYRALQLGDLNGDEIDDIIISDYSDDDLIVFTGQSSGSFQAVQTITFGHGEDVTIVDLNDDNVLDFVATGVNTTNTILVGIGNGDGTFDTSRSFSETLSGSANIESGDLNGDGEIDIVYYGNSTDQDLIVRLGNGDGTFGERTTYDFGSASPNRFVKLADINNDGAVDILNNLYSAEAIGIYLGNTQDLMTILDFDLRTQESSLSAMSGIVEVRDRILEERSAIGAQTSRVEVAISNLFSARENYTAAESRILDADIAEESATLVRANILQQAAASVLAQANQQPALALQLLG